MAAIEPVPMPEDEPLLVRVTAFSGAATLVLRRCDERDVARCHEAAGDLDSVVRGRLAEGDSNGRRDR